MRDSVAIEKLHRLIRTKVRHELVTMLMSILLGCGVFMLIVALAKGNWLVFAAPLSLWLAVISFPTNSKGSGARKRARGHQARRVLQPKGQRWGWKICLLGAVWFTAGGGLWSRVGKPNVSNADIAAAIDEGRALFEAQRYNAALSHFRSIYVPDCFPYRKAQKYHNIGLIQYKLNNNTAAEAALKRAVSYDPEDLDAYYLLILIACESNDYDKAYEYICEAKANIGPAGLPTHFEPLIHRVRTTLKKD